MEADEERIFVVVHQHVALRHDVFDLFLSDDCVFLKDFDGVYFAARLVLGKEHLQC